MLAQHDDAHSIQPPHVSWQSLFALAERAPFGIYIVDADFRIALINAEAQERAFRNINPALGRDFASAVRILWPEDVASAVIAEFRRTLTTGAPYHSHDFAYERADSGEIEAYEWDLHRIVLPDGSYGVVCYYYESTRLRADGERQAFLLKFSDALRSEPNEEAVCKLAVKLLCEELHPDNCNLVAINVEADSAVVTHRYGPGEGTTTPYTVRLSDFPTPLRHCLERTVVCRDAPNDPALTPVDRQSLAAMNISAFIGAAVRRGNRNPIWALSVSCAGPRKWTSGEVALVENVAERTWAAIERARAEQALRDADARKDEFLAMLAHELRNPLAAINNAGQILMRSGCDPETLRKTAEILNRQVGHMVRQVDDLLDMSRISRGKIELRKECVNLAKIVNHALESSRPLIESAHHELNVSLPPNPLYVLGDPTRLTQVIGNLLNNAAKFTNAGGRIWLTLEEEGSEAVVRVRDNGIGISGDEQNRIFELFVQLDKSLDRSRDGLGLGLPLVKKLVDMHGGTVRVYSKGLSHGTEFTVRLPTLTSLLPPQPEGSMEATPTPPRRVLVVDDNHDSADSLAALLTLMGHAVDTAHDGVEAVQKAVTFRPDLILLDIGMPRLNGYEAARWIREQGHEKLTLVALTGWGQDEDRRLSAEAGFDAHIVKPIDLATLTKLLANAGQETGATQPARDQDRF